MYRGVGKMCSLYSGVPVQRRLPYPLFSPNARFAKDKFGTSLLAPHKKSSPPSGDGKWEKNRAGEGFKTIWGTGQVKENDVQKELLKKNSSGIQSVIFDFFF